MGGTKLESNKASLTVNGDLDGKGGVGIGLSNSSLKVTGDINNTSIGANNSQVDVGGDITPTTGTGALENSVIIENSKKVNKWDE